MQSTVRHPEMPPPIRSPTPPPIHPPTPPADEVNEAAGAVHHSERLRLLKDTFELVRHAHLRNKASIITFVTGNGVVT
jgi:hypothetical protein